MLGKISRSLKISGIELRMNNGSFNEEVNTMLKIILIAYIVIGVLIGIAFTSIEIRYGKEHHDIENINMFMEAMANGSTAERIGLISVILVMYALVWPGAILLLVLVCIKD